MLLMLVGEVVLGVRIPLEAEELLVVVQAMAGMEAPISLVVVTAEEAVVALPLVKVGMGEMEASLAVVVAQAGLARGQTMPLEAQEAEVK